MTGLEGAPDDAGVIADPDHLVFCRRQQAETSTTAIAKVFQGNPQVNLPEPFSVKLGAGSVPIQSGGDGWHSGILPSEPLHGVRAGAL